MNSILVLFCSVFPLISMACISVQKHNRHCDIEIALPDLDIEPSSEQEPQSPYSNKKQHSFRQPSKSNNSTDLKESRTSEFNVNRGQPKQLLQLTPSQSEDTDQPQSSQQLQQNGLDTIEQTPSQSEDTDQPLSKEQLEQNGLDAIEQWRQEQEQEKQQEQKQEQEQEQKLELKQKQEQEQRKHQNDIESREESIELEESIDVFDEKSPPDRTLSQKRRRANPSTSFARDPWSKFTQPMQFSVKQNNINLYNMQRQQQLPQQKNNITSKRSTRITQKSLSHRILSLKRENKTTQTLSIVVGGFIVCWLPFFICYLITPFVGEQSIDPTLNALLTWLGWFNSAMNPFIYAFYSVDFRAAFWRLTLKRFFGKSKSTKYSTNAVSVRR